LFFSHGLDPRVIIKDIPRLLKRKKKSTENKYISVTGVHLLVFFLLLFF